MALFMNVISFFLLTSFSSLPAASGYNIEDAKKEILKLCLTDNGDVEKGRSLIDELNGLCGEAEKEKKLPELLSAKALFTPPPFRVFGCLQWPVGTNMGETNHRSYLRNRVLVAKSGEAFLVYSPYFPHHMIDNCSEKIEVSQPGLIHLAAAHAPPELVKRLLELGANSEESDLMGRKPALYAQMYCRDDNEKELSINIKPAKR